MSSLTTSTSSKKQSPKEGRGMPAYLESFLSLKGDGAPFDPEDLPTLKKLREAYIEFLLEATGFNLSETAKILNISRTTLSKRLARPDRFRASEAS